MNSLTPSEPPYTNILNLTTIFNSISSSTMDDTFAQKIIEKLNSMTPLVGWNRQADRLYYEQRLYVPDHENLCLQVIHNHHDHPTAGHFGQTKTIDLIKWNFHWPGLGQMMKSYVNSSMNCTCTKTRRHKPYGQLQQMPIPVQP